MTIDVLFGAIVAASFLGVFQLGRLVERDRWKGRMRALTSYEAEQPYPSHNVIYGTGEDDPCNPGRPQPVNGLPR